MLRTSPRPNHNQSTDQFMGIIFLIGLLGSCLVFGPGLVAGVIAWQKGYRPWFWLLSFGPVGMILILFKPNLNKATTPEERERWESRADWTGGVLSGFTAFVMFGIPLIAVVGYFSMSLTPAAPRPVPPAPPMTAKVIEPAPVSSGPATTAEAPSVDKTGATPQDDKPE